MKVQKNDTSTTLLKYKENTGATWEEVAKLIGLSKMTFYNRMANGGWRDMEVFYIRQKLK